jgi:hypothetical protein
MMMDSGGDLVLYLYIFLLAVCTTDVRILSWSARDGEGRSVDSQYWVTISPSRRGIVAPSSSFSVSLSPLIDTPKHRKGQVHSFAT